MGPPKTHPQAMVKRQASAENLARAQEAQEDTQARGPLYIWVEQEAIHKVHCPGGWVWTQEKVAA